jgi:hypothetical protein
VGEPAAVREAEGLVTAIAGKWEEVSLVAAVGRTVRADVVEFHGFLLGVVCWLLVCGSGRKRSDDVERRREGKTQEE